jgi:flagellar secretion chaperone FliS
VESALPSATPHQLVLMLFEGAQAAIGAAKAHMQLGATAAKGEAICKAVSIIDNGLRASLDVRQGGSLALSLQALYEYMVRRLTLANLRDDRAALDEVGRLLAELADAWQQISDKPADPAGAAMHPANYSKV